MTKVNDTIYVSPSMGLEIDFNKIVYADDSNGPTWLTANISHEDICKWCGADPLRSLTITEDDLEAVLRSWLANHLKTEVVSFRWMWDTYKDAKVA